MARVQGCAKDLDRIGVALTPEASSTSVQLPHNLEGLLVKVRVAQRIPMSFPVTSRIGVPSRVGFTSPVGEQSLPRR